MNNELERVWKEAVPISFEKLSWNLLAQTLKNEKLSMGLASLRTGI
jgi:hypothetical protein